MNKKKNIISLAMELEIQERLKRVAEKKHISVSKLIRDLVEKYIKDTDDLSATVILKIPAELKANPAELEKWLQTRSSAIVKTLTSK